MKPGYAGLFSDLMWRQVRLVEMLMQDTGELAVQRHLVSDVGY